jgi:hypothetical protein
LTQANTLITKGVTLNKVAKSSNVNLTQAQLQTLANDLRGGNLKDPSLAHLNLTASQLQALLLQLKNDLKGNVSDQQLDRDILNLLDRLANNGSIASNNNNDNDENNEGDNDDDDNTAAPAPVLYPTGLSYSFVSGTSFAYVDGFGPVLVASVATTTGQTVVMPVAPYNLNMLWGSFVTYGNWAAQFQAQNGRPPVEADQVQFWVSQAVAGLLTIS